MSEQRIPYSVRLEKADREKLSQVAAATTRSPANFLRWAIRLAHRAIFEDGHRADDAIADGLAQRRRKEARSDA